MKKVLRVVLIVLLLLAILAAACVLLYRHFVTNQIMDRGGMENPFPDSAAEEVSEPASEAAAGAAVDDAEEANRE